MPNLSILFFQIKDRNAIGKTILDRFIFVFSPKIFVFSISYKVLTKKAQQHIIFAKDPKATHLVPHAATSATVTDSSHAPHLLYKFYTTLQAIQNPPNLKRTIPVYRDLSLPAAVSNG